MFSIIRQTYETMALGFKTGKLSKQRNKDHSDAFVSDKGYYLRNTLSRIIFLLMIFFGHKVTNRHRGIYSLQWL